MLICCLVSACSERTPKNTGNACAIFKQYPHWYWNAIEANDRYHVPISVMMAIMRQESDFSAQAMPPRMKLLHWIPLSRPSTAYGYSQSLNGTWQEYQQLHPNADRDSFDDAIDFVGWFAARAHAQLGIPLNNSYALYLAYHEGLGGYVRKSYLRSPGLVNIAHRVQQQANRYRLQLMQCHAELKSKPFWWI